jgi:hypothetical protein
MIYVKCSTARNGRLDIAATLPAETSSVCDATPGV